MEHPHTTENNTKQVAKLRSQVGSTIKKKAQEKQRQCTNVVGVRKTQRYILLTSGTECGLIFSELNKTNFV